MGDGIQAIGKVSRNITDAAYGFATGKTKKVKLEELISGHGSVPQPPAITQGPTVFGWGYGKTSSDTASSNF